MAVIEHTKTDVDGRHLLVTWANITENDTCESFGAPAEPEVSALLSGDFGGGTIGLEVSMDDSTYVAVRDASGTLIAASAEDCLLIGPHGLYLRPSQPTGSSADVTVQLLVVVKGR